MYHFLFILSFVSAVTQPQQSYQYSPHTSGQGFKDTNQKIQGGCHTPLHVPTTVPQRSNKRVDGQNNKHESIKRYTPYDINVNSRQRMPIDYSAKQQRYNTQKKSHESPPTQPYVPVIQPFRALETQKISQAEPTLAREYQQIDIGDSQAKSGIHQTYTWNPEYSTMTQTSNQCASQIQFRLDGRSQKALIPRDEGIPASRLTAMPGHQAGGRLWDPATHNYQRPSTSQQLDQNVVETQMTPSISSRESYLPRPARLASEHQGQQDDHAHLTSTHRYLSSELLTPMGIYQNTLSAAEPDPETTSLNEQEGRLQVIVKGLEFLIL